MVSKIKAEIRWLELGKYIDVCENDGDEVEVVLINRTRGEQVITDVPVQNIVWLSKLVCTGYSGYQLYKGH